MKNKVILTLGLFLTLVLGSFYLIYTFNFQVCEGQILTKFQDREDSKHFHITSNFGDIFKDVSISRGSTIPKVIYLEPNLTYISNTFSQKEIDMLQKCYNKPNLDVTQI